jgi:hypothetical protein
LARRAVIALVLGACAAFPAAAHAGSYDVYSCKFGSAFYGNNAWTAVNNAGGGAPSYSAPDVTCATPGDPLIAVLRAANFGKGVSSQVLFSSPVDTRITDYSVQLVHRYSVTGSANPAGGVYRNNSTFTMAVFGAYAFSLTGEYDPGVIGYVTGPPNHYWGGGGPVTQTVTLSKSDGPPAMLSNQPTAGALALYAGCWGGAPDVCGMAAGSVSQLELTGSRVTIEDTRPPDLTAVQAGRGLLAPGTRAGDEPVTFSAADNTGIRRAELVDVTNAANPTMVASEDYNAGPNTDVGSRFQPGVGWRVFGNTRTRKSGTFTVRYYFQRASRGRFTFRIRLRPNDAYPYSRGTSRRMRVRVG